MGTTLTRETILKRAKPRYEEVEIEGWGTVGIRSCTKLRASQRASRLFDDDGSRAAVWDFREAHRIIDQVMVDEKTPMFQESDAQALVDLDEAALEPLMQAITRFNNEGSAKNLAASKNGSES